jgi:hypothetical protein
MTLRIISIFIAALSCAPVARSQDTPVASTAVRTQSVNTQNEFARHRIHVRYGMGFANSMYDEIDRSFVHVGYALNSTVEMQYAFFFARKWGIGLGIGVSGFSAKSTLNIEGVIPHYNDPAFDPSGQRSYDLRYRTDNLVEQQRIWAVETPLQLLFEHRPSGRTGFFAGLGVKGYFPVLGAQSTFREGLLTVAGYESYTDVLFVDPPHFGPQELRTTPATAKLQYSVDAVADLGAIIKIGRAIDLYAGVYGSYGFRDILPKAADKKDVIAPEHNNLFSLNSLLASNYPAEYNKYIDENRLTLKHTGEKWNLLHIGIKIGINYKLTKKR